MHNARALRASSSRDVCIFCAARQVAPRRNPSIPSPAQYQRRHLNSSVKAPQSVAEDQLYEQRPPPLTLAQRQRQLLERNAALLGSAVQHAAPAARPQTLAQRQRQSNEKNAAFQSLPIRHTPSSNRHQDNASQGRYGNPNTSGNFSKRGVQGRPAQANRTTVYRMNMNIPPPDAPSLKFNPNEHLRRRENPSAAQPAAASEAPRPRAPIRKLDAAELERLLQSNSRGPAGPNTASPRKSAGNVPGQPHSDGLSELLRLSENQDRSNGMSRPPAKFGMNRSSRHQERQFQQPESLSNAAEEWLRKNKPTEGGILPSQYAGDADRRSATDENERRRRRFMIESESAAHHQYTEPLPSYRSKDDRRRRNNNRGFMNVDEDALDEVAVRAERKRTRKEAKRQAQLNKSEPTPVLLPEYISVANLASLLKLRVEDFVRKLEELGFEDVQNDHILNSEHAALIAMEYNFEPIVQTQGEDGDLYPAPAPTPEEYALLPARPPVVTIMGHVDHGKTTILDYMRNSSVAATEFGGITQHIGAFSVPLSSGKKITFLDTPGHAAFETMRKRGANVTDIVVLVVAADDSVKPQTVEAIKHAQAAGVPMIVAINKIDKNQANPEKVKQDLAMHGVEVEDFGGDTQTVLLSGKTGQGIPDLEEAISTLSEILDHRADPEASVEGWILEASTKKSGRVATVLVRSGTLHPGDVIVAGNTWARVKTLKNEAGVLIEQVGPGMPVEVDGWREQPVAGDEVLQAPDEQKASDVAELRLEKDERDQMAKDMDAINESRKQEFERKKAEEAAAAAEAGAEAEKDAVAKVSGPETIPFIVKADVSGSVEAVVDSISSIGNNEVGCRILRSGVGSPSEFDIQHAADAKGHIVNFNTVVAPHIASMAEQKGVKILESNIIYRVVETVKAMLSEKLAPRITQRVIGEAEVAAIFDIGLGGKKKLKVAGSKVRNGFVDKKQKVKVFRGETVVYDGTLSSLKNQKKDVDVIRKDTDCGMAFDGWEDFKVGDKIQSYEEIREKRSL